MTNYVKSINGTVKTSEEYFSELFDNLINNYEVDDITLKLATEYADEDDGYIACTEHGDEIDDISDFDISDYEYQREKYLERVKTFCDDVKDMNKAIYRFYYISDCQSKYNDTSAFIEHSISYDTMRNSIYTYDKYEALKLYEDCHIRERADKLRYINTIYSYDMKAVEIALVPVSSLSEALEDGATLKDCFFDLAVDRDIIKLSVSNTYSDD